MTRVPLITGAYQARSLAAECQRSVNLYAELNPKDAPVPFTYYPTPGLVLETAGSAGQVMRCLYRDSRGYAWCAINDTVYFIEPADLSLSFVGTINNGALPVRMSDNGQAMIIVDGSGQGWAVDIYTHDFDAIPNINFYGANTVDCVDGYFILNRPGTQQFYISLNNSTYLDIIGGTAFDPLDIAAKNGSPDFLQAVVVSHREVWLIGQLTTEVWYNSGAAEFTFQALPGAFIEHGTIAPYSVAAADSAVYWLGRDKQGQRIVFRGFNYQGQRISTHAIENEFQSYNRVDDAIGYCYQIQGHNFYVLIFPTESKTWVYDLSTEQWNEWAYLDNNGQLLRHRSNCYCQAYFKKLVGDYENGNLYSLNINTYTDNGQPITRIRGLPHLESNGDRMFHNSITIDMDPGNDDGSVDGSDADNPPKISVRWSDTRGHSWGNYVQQSLGAAGEYLTSIQINRCGMARDRVYEVMWSVPAKTALQGAWVEVTPVAT